MIDTYDMQVLDYSQDHDIQMHASSSDQWFQDETKMEEDAPNLFKDENDLHMNPARYSDEKADCTIEVEMEPALDQQHTEFDMLDDDTIHTTEIVDVEVYDASHVQSPAMLAVDSVEGHFLIPSEAHVQELSTPNPETLPLESPNPLPVLELQGMHPDTTRIGSGNTADESPSEAAYIGQSADCQPSLETETHIEHPNSTPEVVHNDVIENPHAAQDEVVPGAAAYQVDQRSEAGGVQHLELQDNDVRSEINESHTDTAVVHGDGASSGDPHEISEGVYIDPPPPVLFSMNSDDQFNFSLFNEPSVWNEVVSGATDTDYKYSQEHVLLSSFPTLYYEPISAVFDALRQEECIQSMISVRENELIMEAVDLQLVISEDNIYAREVTLHDLNVLHDISGIDGLLRMRFYASTPRFITRYQHLQDEVSRLNLEAATIDPNSESTDRTLPIEEQHEASTVFVDLATDRNNGAAESVATSQQSLSGEPNAHITSHDADVQGTFEYSSSEAANGSSETQEPLSGDAVEPQIDDQEANEGAGSEESHNTYTGPDHHIAVLNQSAENDENDDQTEALTHYDSVTNEHSDSAETTDFSLLTAEDDLPITTNETEHNLAKSTGNDTIADHGEVNGEVQEEQSDFARQHEGEDEEYEQYHVNPSSVRNETDEADENSEIVLELGPNEEVEDDTDEYEESTEDTSTSVRHLDAVNPQNISNGSVYDKASVIADKATEFAEEGIEGDAAGDTSVSYEESVSNHTFDEFSHTEETGQRTGASSEYAFGNSEFFDETEQSWAYDFDDKGEDPTEWDKDTEPIKAVLDSTSTTLSSKASKRSFDEVNLDGEEYEYGALKHLGSPGSPGPKRTKMQ